MKRRAILSKGSDSQSDNPQWYKDAIIYEARVRSFYDANGDGLGDFRGLAEKLDYLQDLGVTAIWLLPFYPSPLRDDGYDISDYTDVHPDVGTLADFKMLLDEAHARGLRVITELVLNHTSDQHPWFQRARRSPPGSAHRNFYVWSDTAERYKDARIIFKDFEPSNWAWDPVAKAYFWHRFYAHQPDLNFESLEVQKELFAVVDFWLALGVDGLRLDAVPYLYEAEGSNCENLPETHTFLKKLRAHIDANFKDRMLLAEANQWPEDAAAYYGDGDECHMNFHFPIMPRLFMAIHMEDRLPILDILAQTPPIHPSCQWALFLRNHDELTLEMVTDEERDYMYRAYASETSMRINLGIRRRLAPLVRNDRQNMELMNALLLSLPGTPVLYYGDEIGMGDNVYLGDRNGVRTPMQWSADRNAGFSRANPQRLILPIIIDPEYHYESINVEAQQNNSNSLLWWMKRIIALRKRFKAFGRGSIEFLNPENSKVIVFVRQFEGETILVVANLSRFVQFAEIDLSKWKGLRPIELFGRTAFPVICDTPYLLTLGGHAFYWFSLEKPKGAEDDARAASYHVPTIDAQGSWEAIFREGASAPLEELLPSFLETRRWFPRDRSITTAKIIDSIPVTEAVGGVHIVIVNVEYADGDPERYTLPLAFETEDRAADVKARLSQSVLASMRVQTKTGAVQGVLFEALCDSASCRVLLDAMLRRRVMKGTAGELVASTERPLDISPTDALALDPRLINADHASAAVIYGDRFILKLFRRMDEGTSPDLELGRFLERRSAHGIAPPLVGALEYVAGRREPPITVTTLQGYIPNESDAWTYARKELGRFYDRVLSRGRDMQLPAAQSRTLVSLFDQDPPAEVGGMIGPFLDNARQLGKRTAELHLALASDTEDPAFAPEPFSSLYQRQKYQSMRNITGKVMRLLRTRVGTLSEATAKQAQGVLEREEKLFHRFEALLHRRITVMRIRTHGNYHLGQVLFTGKDFVVVDFEGDRSKALSERRRKRTALKDVASMLRSFHYAAFTALLDQTVVRPEDRAMAEPWAHAWTAWTSAVFLRSYLDTAGNAAFVPTDRDELAVLLDIAILEKALAELGFELGQRSERVIVPLQGLAHMLDVGDST